ncbi:threonine synthase [Campylobacter porcelli]|uniref:Threonine synthase n=2 Tax=Campylobacter porcelli TaxID=1660073 RepID=A0A1X9SWI9_9BACT|nr:threonine synthase [Campylobacter sp. RM6137]
MKFIIIKLEKDMSKKALKELSKHKSVYEIYHLNQHNAKKILDINIDDSKELIAIIGKYKKIKSILERDLPELIRNLEARKLNEMNPKSIKALKDINLPKLVGTRANFTDEDNEPVNLDYALLNPAAKYGGLYAPINLPLISKKEFKKLSNMDYNKFALEIIKKFNFNISLNKFKKAIDRYNKFDKSAVEIKKINKNLYINELWHGPTRAFKDMALQPFGELLSSLSNGNKQLIMCATSGDTGPATLSSFENAKDIKVVCLYPKDGTSQVQRLQMINQKAPNLKVIGIEGNFDDAQQALKMLLNDDEFKNTLKDLGYNLSAANSVNFGRILFQIIYHIYVCVHINKNEKPIDIIIPSGNFGNALGAYYAKKMGANIDKIKIASNKNNILTEFFNTGIYDLNNKELIHTISPAMDILISSNIERLLFDKFGPVRTKELMDNLANNKKYELTNDELEVLKAEFQADYCDDDECMENICKVAKNGILIDPHTATCLKLTQDDKISVITSTAQWVKFTPSMIKALKNRDSSDELADMKLLADKYHIKLPKSIIKLFKEDEIHTQVVKKDEIKSNIIDWIKR